MLTDLHFTRFFAILSDNIVFNYTHTHTHTHTHTSSTEFVVVANFRILLDSKMENKIFRTE